MYAKSAMILITSFLVGNRLRWRELGKLGRNHGNKPIKRGWMFGTR